MSRLPCFLPLLDRTPPLGTRAHSKSLDTHSQLKALQKQREKEAKKAEKAANAPQTTKKAKAADDSELDAAVSLLCFSTASWLLGIG